MKTKLAALKGSPQLFEGRIFQRGFDGGGGLRLCVVDISCNGVVVSDHCWVAAHPILRDVKMGEKFKFKARVYTYKTRRGVDFGIKIMEVLR